VLGVGPGVAGIDLFIAEEALTGQGLGTEVIRRFVHDVVFARLDLTACVADPESANVASLRAFEKAGFRRVKEFVDPEEGTSNVLVRFDRPQSAPGYDEPL
jgi:RimJ/RimL family protein N-acetyltransferase